MDHNHRLAQIFRQMAALLDEQGVAFKPAAYRRGAQVIEDLKKDVELFENEKELMKLPGIGEAIASKTVEFVKTGKIAAYEEMLKEHGGLSGDLLAVEGLGPKRVRQLQEIGIQSVPDLIKAAEQGKLRSLPRFSELMEKKILEDAGRVTERSRRFARAEVAKDVEKILTTLRDVEGVERCEAAGSYRREKETIGDLDILVVTKKPDKVTPIIAALPILERVVAQGDKKMSFDLKSGLRVDVRFVKAVEWGSALLYFTGDKEHNIALRKLAISNGWKLNEYGLFNGAKPIARTTEGEIYGALGLGFIEPKERSSVI